MKTQELFEFGEGDVGGTLYVFLKITDEFTEQDASEVVNDFAMREGGEVEDEDLPREGEYYILFETIEEAKRAKKSFRRLSRMRPGFKILDYEAWEGREGQYGNVLSFD